MKILYSLLTFISVFLLTLAYGFLNRPRLLGVQVPMSAGELGSYGLIGIILGIVAAIALFAFLKKKSA